MKKIVVLQARSGSQRYPKKALLPIGNTTVLGAAAIRSLKIEVDSHWFVTTNLPEDDALVEICQSLGFRIYRGQVYDVLSRFEAVIQKTEADIIVRVTGDNPLVSYELTNQMISIFRNQYQDVDSLRPSEDWPIGLLPEVFKSTELLRVRNMLRGDEHFHQSHVTSKLVEISKIHFFETKSDWSKIGKWRLTLDEELDYQLFREISNIYKPKFIENIPTDELRDLLQANQQLSEINFDVRQKNIEEG